MKSTSRPAVLLLPFVMLHVLVCPLQVIGQSQPEVFDSIMLTNRSSSFSSQSDLPHLDESVRNKRQTFNSWGGKRTEFDNEELNESVLDNDNANNRKKSKTFVAWGGKRSLLLPLWAVQMGTRSSPATTSAAPQLRLDSMASDIGDWTPALKRFRAWGGKRTDKPFRTWGGKRSLESNPNDSDIWIGLMMDRLQQSNSNWLDSSSLPLFFWSHWESAF